MQGPGMLETNPLISGPPFGMPKKDAGPNMKGLFALLRGDKFPPTSGPENKQGQENPLSSIPVPRDGQQSSLPALGQPMEQEPTLKQSNPQREGLGLPILPEATMLRQPAEEQLLQKQQRLGQLSPQQPAMRQQEAGEEQIMQPQSTFGQLMQQQPVVGQQEAGEEQAMPKPTMGQPLLQQPIPGHLMLQQPMPGQSMLKQTIPGLPILQQPILAGQPQSQSSIGRSMRPSMMPMGQFPGMSLLVPQLSLETEVGHTLLSQLLPSKNSTPSETLPRGTATGLTQMALPAKVTKQSTLLRYNPTMDPKMASELVQLLKVMLALHIL